MKKVYIGGPDVFRLDAQEFFRDVAQTCARLQLIPLMPYAPTLTKADVIFQRNLDLLRGCDYMVANVDCFRGAEPDSGTAWEIGFAFALNKPIISYTFEPLTVRERVARHFEMTPEEDPSLARGTWIENFKSPVNLMLAQSGPVVIGSIDDALLQIATRAYRLINPGSAEIIKLPARMSASATYNSEHLFTEEVEFKLDWLPDDRAARKFIAVTLWRKQVNERIKNPNDPLHQFFGKRLRLNCELI